MIKKTTNTNDQKYSRLKFLTKCMLDPNVNSSIIEKSDDFNSTYKYKMFNHILIYPKIVKYINEYLNNLFTFHKYSPVEWIKTFANILKQNNVSTLYYSKYKTSKKDDFIKTIDNYNKFMDDREYNIKEYNCLYDLYINGGILEASDIENLKKISSGKEEGKTKTQISVFEEEPIINQISSDNQLINNVEDFIKNRQGCKSCSFHASGIGNIITNVNSEEKVDVVFVSLYPLQKNNKLTELLSNTTLKYFIIGTNFCGSIKNNATATQLKNNLSICSSIFTTFIDEINPKYKVLLGTKVKSILGISTPITKILGQVLRDNTIVEYSEEEIELDKKKEDKFKEILLFLEENKHKTKIIEKESSENNNLEDYLLFDIKTIDTNNLYIYTHKETGEKKYVTKSIEFPIHIRYGNFQECDYIVDNIDKTVIVTSREKNELSKILNYNIKNIISNV